MAVDIETASERYAARFKGATGEWLLNVQGKATLRMLERLPGASILEAGGGHGQLTPFLTSAGCDVMVHGSSDACRERIREWMQAGRVRFRSGDLMNLPFPDHSYDVVIAYHLLSHIEDADGFVRELTRVARQAVIVDYPSARSLNGLTSGLFWLKKMLEGNTRHFITYSEKRVMEAFEAQGFRCREKHPKFFLPMVLHRVLKQPKLSEAAEKIFRGLGLTRLFGSPVIACFTRDNPS
jgi:2-polyprenyl-3-methyl-5-hydroxy-6-metoxy-1,4-benzoquinol methylase